jgi:hypothetical protein
MGIKKVNWWREASQETVPLRFASVMLVIFLLGIRGTKHILPPRFPFINGFQILSEFPSLFLILDIIYWSCLILIVIGFRYKNAAFTLGLIIFFQIGANSLLFSNSFLFAGCLLLLIGVYRQGNEWTFRWQICLLYAGAGLNKALEFDWWNGNYFKAFFEIYYPNPLISWVSDIFPEASFYTLLGVFTIFMEIGLAIWVIVNRRMVSFFIATQAFHLTMLIMTLGELSYIFYFLISIAAYLVLPWNEIFLHESKNQENLFHDQKSLPGRRISFKEEIIINYLKKSIITGILIVIISFSCKYNHLIFNFLERI